jgi:hypothetical protein
MAAVSLDSFMGGDDLDLSAPQPAAPAEIKTVLVVGSQQAAADGSYQALVTELGDKGAVEMHMHDRITQGGEFSPALSAVLRQQGAADLAGNSLMFQKSKAAAE